ncbi:ethyl tert-butyl ether degradation protein EthD [Rhodococcus sp. 05-2254-6]|uniref:EthD family reductase n=1 Tax=Rhodococcus sp. 05-2254-6 TaxID=2022489 RepID=UPI000B9B4CB0|nr:EthD family reductase [Rhodococcus sp. 05-2254-6]OZE44939.1 ethyl tert-butyl ether degradation protein EthD [Rhodococcus sp. 05-2254-6]
MSIRVAVCYGMPEDPAAFDRHYAEVHVPLARAVPGLVDFTWGTLDSLDDAPPAYYAIASLYFADEASLKAGLSSPEMKAAGKDLRNFATGGAVMFTQNERSVLQS